MTQLSEELSVLIIEDEEIWSSSLADNLQEFGFLIAGIANNFELAISLLNTTYYDIVLLDININHKNSGIELGKMIYQLYKKPFIFITASQDSHTSTEAIAAHPSAYLIKPVNPVSLFVTIQSAIANYQNNVTAHTATDDYSSFFVKQGNKYKKIDWNDVVYLSSEKKYTGIFNALDASEYFIRSTLPKTLNYIIPKNLQKNFVQINRAEIVNIGFVQELIGDELKTKFKTLNVTESYFKELKERLNIIT